MQVGAFFIMLTTAQQTAIRFYLGQSSIHRYLNPRLEGLWGALDSDSENIIITILGQLAAVDNRLFGSGVGFDIGFAAKAAGVKALEEIQFAGDGAAVDRGLRRLGRVLISRLSGILGVPPYADVYGSQGWPGDNYSRNGLSNRGSGNSFELG